jgi:hypothetical protein
LPFLWWSIDDVGGTSQLNPCMLIKWFCIIADLNVAR